MFIHVVPNIIIIIKCLSIMYRKRVSLCRIQPTNHPVSGLISHLSSHAISSSDIVSQSIFKSAETNAVFNFHLLTITTIDPPPLTYCATSVHPASVSVNPFLVLAPCTCGTPSTLTIFTLAFVFKPYSHTFPLPPWTCTIFS